MQYLYVLKNRLGRHYIGITNLSPDIRLERHNKGDVYSTRLGKPWELVHSESFETMADARMTEKKIKSWKGGNAFIKFLSKTAGSSNGRTSPFEGEYLGSNPSPAVLERNRHKFGGVKWD